MSLRSLDSLEAAADLIQSVMRPTPQFRWPLLSARTSADVFQAFHNK